MLFVIEGVGTWAKIPGERTIALKTEIKDNWDEYWRVSEKLTEETERQDDDDVGGNAFSLWEKSHINEEEQHWKTCLRFVPSVT